MVDLVSLIFNNAGESDAGIMDAMMESMVLMIVMIESIVLINLMVGNQSFW